MQENVSPVMRRHCRASLACREQPSGRLASWPSESLYYIIEKEEARRKKDENGVSSNHEKTQHAIERESVCV